METTLTYPDYYEQYPLDTYNPDPLVHQQQSPHAPPPPPSNSGTGGHRRLDRLGEATPSYPQPTNTTNAEWDALCYPSYSYPFPFSSTQAGAHSYTPQELNWVLPPTAVTPQSTDATEFGQSTFLLPESDSFFYQPFVTPAPPPSFSHSPEVTNATNFTTNMNNTTPTSSTLLNFSDLGIKFSTGFADPETSSSPSTDSTPTGGSNGPIGAANPQLSDPFSNMGAWQDIPSANASKLTAPMQVPLEEYSQQQLTYLPPTDSYQRRDSISCMSLSSSTSSSSSLGTPSKKRTFRCRICSAEFKRRRDRERHIRSLHTRLTPYLCKGCGEGFVRSDARGRHWRNYPECRDNHRTIVQQESAQSPDSS